MSAASRGLVADDCQLASRLAAREGFVYFSSMVSSSDLVRFVQGSYDAVGF